MFCKYCGKEIDDNSTFCKHCGKSQDSSSKSPINKPMWIVYLIWTLGNMYLLIGKKIFKASSYFYPFTGHKYTADKYHDFIYCDWDKQFYDFSEFIFYVFILPSILYVVYRRYHTKIDKFLNRLLKN